MDWRHLRATPITIPSAQIFLGLSVRPPYPD